MDAPTITEEMVELDEAYELTEDEWYGLCAESYVMDVTLTSHPYYSKFIEIDPTVSH